MIEQIFTKSRFDELTQDWRVLKAEIFGGVIDQLESFEQGDLDIEDMTANVKAFIVNGECVAYITADDNEGWCLETKEGHRGNGYAKKLCDGITFANEVCSDIGAAFCESLGIDF